MAKTTLLVMPDFLSDINGSFLQNLEIILEQGCSKKHSKLLILFLQTWPKYLNICVYIIKHGVHYSSIIDLFQ